MWLKYVCQEPMWDLTDDIHQTPPRCLGEGVLSVTPEAWMEGGVGAECPKCRHWATPADDHFEIMDYGLPLAALVLVERGERVLGVSRKDQYDMFGLPGGKVDPIDVVSDSAIQTLRNAAVREFREECGISVDPAALDVCWQGLCAWGERKTWVMVFTAPDMAEPCTQEGEGIVSWVTWGQLEAGPFGKFNAALRQYVGQSHGAW